MNLFVYYCISISYENGKIGTGEGTQSRAAILHSTPFRNFFLDFFYPITFIKFGYYQNKYYLCGVI